LKTSIIALAGLVLAGLSGCGGSSTSGSGSGGPPATIEDAMKKMIPLMNGLAEVVEKNDEAKATSIAKELKEVSEQGEALFKKLSKEEANKLEEKLKGLMEEGDKAERRLRDAMKKNPDLAKKLEQYKPK
jgi:cytochrome c556